MLGFHIDMNTAQYSKPYLFEWLVCLKKIGYNTIVWEVENNIQWETCPECCSPNAFSKTEFKEILQFCRNIGLDVIPLFQVLGHCEYVLKWDSYKKLAESPDQIEQYCPSNPDVRNFIKKWIEEYLDLFGPVSYFHIGADEARYLGKCPACKEIVQNSSVSALYINYINAIVEPIEEKGITPVIWGDMVLHHNEALSLLSKKITIFDWMYDIYRGNGKFYIWGEGPRNMDTVTTHALQKFHKYLFPRGEESGAVPETFYTVDYLADNGFRVVTCPGSSSYGDSVFAPQNLLHLRNTIDSMKKGLYTTGADGTVLTSWSVHAFPWELQRATIEIAGYVLNHPSGSLEEFQIQFTKMFFNAADGDFRFWEACRLLSRPCIFSTAKGLGYYKDCRSPSEKFIQEQIEKWKRENKIASLVDETKKLLGEYSRALHLFQQLEKEYDDKSKLLTHWNFSARQLANRAKISLILLTNALDSPLPERYEMLDAISELDSLKREFLDKYLRMMRPVRAEELTKWIFNPIQYAVRNFLTESETIRLSPGRVNGMTTGYFHASDRSAVAQSAAQ